jgi:NTE family protein
VVTNLVLLHSKQTQKPKNTASWLQEFPFHLHHHVKMDVTRHFKRLIRFIRGRANGLVLSGGGTRGFAHLGAIKALREEKIPLDFIGGTSVGAIVGGAYAMQESYQDAYQKFNEIVTASSKSVAWSSLTWPIISLFNGKFFTDILYKVFNKHQIEDLWIPYFCISSNLANYSEEIHQNGSLFEKTRASASIPGIIPPMIINGEIHFDGGLLNNLPVDIMRQFLGKKAKIIAIELTASMHDLHKYQFPPVLTFKETLMIKMHLLKQHFIFPRFVDIFIRGLLMGSSVRSRQNGLSATILVNLSLRKFRLLQTTPKQSAKMLEIGYLETLSKIQHYKNKDS